MRQLVLLSLAFGLVPLSGCIAAAAAGAGVVAANNTGTNNVYVTQVQKDSKAVWATVKEFLSKESKEIIETNEAARTATATLDDARVTVQVETWDADQTKMTVSAKRFFATVNDGELAKVISDRLWRRIND